MIRACCPECRLRFSPAASVYLDACPDCGRPPQALASLQHAVGFRLIKLDVFPNGAPESAAAAVSVPISARTTNSAPDAAR
jgi:hypothetical protein